MMHRSMWDEKYKKQADVRMKYIDDVNHHSPPDYYPGDLGYYYTLSNIGNLDPRSYRFQLEWYWPYFLYTPDGPRMKTIKDICNIRDNKLIIKAGDKQVNNTGAVLNPLIP